MADSTPSYKLKELKTITTWSESKRNKKLK